MEILRKDKLVKLKRKNRGNSRLTAAIDKLIADIENSVWKTKKDILRIRSDADCVHHDGFYIFDIHIHRTMILIVFEDEEAVIIWAGSHDEYETIFKSNRNTIEKWLRNQQLI